MVAPLIEQTVSRRNRSAVTSTLVILGASLMDAGNIAGLAPVIGRKPFVDSIYDKGGNVRASDGPVLGEHVVRRMGGDPMNRQLFDVLSFESAQSVDVHNYAHGGAQSDGEPSQSLFGLRVGIGLADQVQSMQQRADFYQSHADVDVLISSGGNDLLNTLGDLKPFERVLSTEKNKDDRRFMRSISRPISRNIIRAVDDITGLVDEMVVIGTLPISETPRARRRASKVKGARQEDVLELLDAISLDLQRRLGKAFDSRPDVALLDGRSLWTQLDNPVFLDDEHPNSRTSKRFATLAVPLAAEQLQSFGFDA